MKSFNYQTKVELFETDASGVIFYSQLFHIVHRAFSAFLNHNQISIQDRLLKQDFMFPVVHAEGDYLAPIYTEDIIDIELKVLKIGESSFVIGYELFKNKNCVGRAKVVHVAIGPDRTKIALPKKIKDAFNCF